MPPDDQRNRRAADAAIEQLQTDMQAVKERLDSGARRMNAMQTELTANTAVTSEVRDILDAGRTGLRVLGGLTWLDAKQQATGSATTDGKRVIGVPEMQANIGAEWDVPGVRGLAVDGRLVHTGSSYANATNTLKVGGWNRLDLGVRYLTEVQGKLVTLRLRIDNVADKNYWASVGGYPGSGYLTVSAPRTVSLSASVDF